jgi:hypothetical protein
MADESMYVTRSALIRSQTGQPGRWQLATRVSLKRVGQIFKVARSQSHVAGRYQPLPGTLFWWRHQNCYNSTVVGDLNGFTLLDKA